MASASSGSPDLPRFWPSGPTWRIGRALGLLDGGPRDAGRLFVALTLVGWLPAILLGGLGALRGHGVAPPLLDPGLHARSLLALPLVLVWMPVLDRQAGRILTWLREVAVLPPAAVERLERRAARALESRGPELAVLLVAFALGALQAPEAGSAAALWAVLVAGTAWRFAFGLALWRWIVWAGVLLGAARAEPDVRPAHPDGVGGLLPLVRPTRAFGLVGFAAGTALTGALAASALEHRLDPQRLAWVAVVHTLVIVTVAAGPLLAFVPAMARARAAAELRYGQVGYAGARAFDERWVPTPDGGALLDSGVSQSLTDLQSSMLASVRMALVPVPRSAVVLVAVLSLLPFLPLLLSLVPAAEVLALVQRALL